MTFRSFLYLRSPQVRALVLWLNSTLGVLLALADRQETQGAWANFKEPVWEAMQSWIRAR